MPYDNRGQVSLWKSDSDHPQAPRLTGKVVAHRNISEGETLDISLWDGESDHPRAPVLKGKIRDKRTGEDSGPTGNPAPPRPPPASAKDFADDDLPF